MVDGPNLYRYTRNNPVCCIDPYGTESKSNAEQSKSTVPGSPDTIDVNGTATEAAGGTTKGSIEGCSCGKGGNMPDGSQPKQSTLDISSTGDRSSHLVDAKSNLQNPFASADVDSLREYQSLVDRAAAGPVSLRQHIGSESYYRRRHDDFVARNPWQPAPDYYLEYGDKYVHKFSRAEAQI